MIPPAQSIGRNDAKKFKDEHFFNNISTEHLMTKMRSLNFAGVQHKTFIFTPGFKMSNFPMILKLFDHVMFQ